MSMKSKWLLLAMAVVATGSLGACAAKAPHASQAVPLSLEAANPQVKRELEPKAVEILKTMSSRLAAARSLRFTAVVVVREPEQARSCARLHDQVRRRPATTEQAPGDHLGRWSAVRVLLRRQDDHGLLAEDDLAAVADAPPTIDGALKAAYDLGETYFPFTDVVVADPRATSPATSSSRSTSASRRWSAARPPTSWPMPATRCSCDLDRCRRQAAAYDPRGVPSRSLAPPALDGALRLAARRCRSGGDVHLVGRDQSEAHRVHPAGSEAAADVTRPEKTK